MGVGGGGRRGVGERVVVVVEGGVVGEGWVGGGRGDWKGGWWGMRGVVGSGRGGKGGEGWGEGKG